MRQEFRTLESSVERLTEGDLNLRPTKSEERYFEKGKKLSFYICKTSCGKKCIFFKFIFLML